MAATVPPTRPADMDRFVDEVEEFVTGHRGPTPARAERVLATVLLTDLVGSTQTAARLGDERWSEVEMRGHGAVGGIAVHVTARYPGDRPPCGETGFAGPGGAPSPAIERGLAGSFGGEGQALAGGAHDVDEFGRLQDLEVSGERADEHREPLE
jgi:hypothetical protein